jgi:uncharacterized protein
MVCIEDELLIKHTLSWINSFVVAFEICPFAHYVIDNSLLEVIVMRSDTINEALEGVLSIIARMEKAAYPETALVIFPVFLEDFFYYLEFVAKAESRLRKCGYAGQYQLATFHPDYSFADAQSDDVANYTNRSPYAMLHILRETSIDKAVQHYGNTAIIPENNRLTLKKLGLQKVQELLSR